MVYLFFHHQERDQRNGEAHAMTLNEQIIHVVTAVAE